MRPTPKIPISNPSMRANVQTNQKALQKTSHDVTSVLEHDELFLCKALGIFSLNLSILSLLHLKLHSKAYFIGKSVVLHIREGTDLRMDY